MFCIKECDSTLETDHGPNAACTPPMPGAPPQIALQGVTKVYPGADGPVTALHEVSLTIERGDIYGIIGMSGAGKSTLIRCLNRLDYPTGGRILVDGRDILAMHSRELLAMRRRMAMIFQQFNLLSQRTVARNVRYPLEIAGVPRRQADERVRELLHLVGLSDKHAAYPSQLSGGQKQRVAIARALAGDPEMLLCDEATSALDPLTTQSILELLSQINARMGITVVLITHEMAVIRQICNKVAILDNGRLAEQGTVDDVFRHTQSAAGKRLFGILPDEAEPQPEEPALRIVFDGEAAEQPIISRAVQATGIAINILSADIRRLSGKAYGQMIIALPVNAGERSQLVGYLTALGLHVEEVNPR